MKEKLRMYTMNSLKFYNLKILDGVLNSNCYVFLSLPLESEEDSFK